MSWRTDQFVPEPPLIHAVIDRALLPEIESTRERLGVPPILAYVDVWVGGVKTSRFSKLVVGPLADQDGTNAEVRLRFRKTSRPGRILLLAQLNMDSIDDKSLFAGLVLRGEVEADNGDYTIRIASSNVAFNRSHWSDPANC